MRRILYIAYAFPPCGGAGVQRSAKFVRYLPEHGWLPTVLTVEPTAYGTLDLSHAAEFPDGVEVVRTPHIDPVASLTRPALAAAKGHVGNGSVRGIWTPKSVTRRALRHGWNAVERNLLVPDRMVTWYPRAVAAGRVLLRRQRFDLILATGEPYSSYFVARALSRRSGVPFVIDMRDPWTMATYRSEKRPRWRQSLERWQERRILASCRACVFAFRPDGLYTDAYPQWAHKFHYIPNGYDPADFEGVEPKQFEKFTIVHSGTFLPGYRPARPFLLALRELLNRQPDIANGLQVLFVGKAGEETKEIAELGLGDVVKQVGYLPHRESISYLRGADVLLLIGGHHKWEETGKVYEYLAARKPILALVHPEGSAAKLLREFPPARVVDREQPAEIVTALQGTLLGWAKNMGAEVQHRVTRYQRNQLTEQLATVLDVSHRESFSGRHTQSRSF